MGSLVALVGRPNVGKSTLFNRLVEKRQAIMYEESGVTRDRHYGEVEWSGRRFTLIDTGGYLARDEDQWSKLIRTQVFIALEEADVLLFMVDCQVSLLPEDQVLAEVLRRLGKPIVIVANKADNYKLSMEASGFHALGLGADIFDVSSVSGSGTGDLLDAIDALLPVQEEVSDEVLARLPRLAILGRPNVGKSTLLNAFVGAQRSVVSGEAGTTRDALTVHYKHFGKEFLLIDTAGVRKRAKMKGQVEFFSTLRALSALQACDVCLFLIDAQLGLEAQDLHLLDLAHRYHKGILLCVNKWDTVAKDTHTQKKWVQSMQTGLGALAYVPIWFGSAVNKQGIFQLLEQALVVYEARKQHVSTSKLNEYLLPLIHQTPPPAHRNKKITIKYVTQLKKTYPHFIFFTNSPQYIPSTYERFLTNSLRRQFGFLGVPLSLSFRKK